MKKITMAVAAASLAFGATAAHADTRPAATDFSQPVADSSEVGGEESELWLLILLGLAALAGIIAAGGSSQGNSPR